MDIYGATNCPNCGKLVHFAERVMSHGKDWHRQCLKCSKCEKKLVPGSHRVVLPELQTSPHIVCLTYGDQNVMTKHCSSLEDNIIAYLFIYVHDYNLFLNSEQTGNSSQTGINALVTILPI
ncbi:unnamed protein product [Calicophoron daubneyi]|uniref:LIM zinc-binding domain-containing protein n=1 Tax=Calicophoron daubneyi TaxID=300641 RepID=A0AAV2T9V2_CALDB